METDTIIIVSSILEASGIAVFLVYVIRGLKSQIKALSNTIDIQKETLSAMESRVEEVQKMGETYSNFTKTLPEFVENYHKTVSLTKDYAISDMQDELERSRRQLKEYRKIVDEVEKDRISEKYAAVTNKVTKT